MSAQNFTVEAKIDSTMILIGEQCNLTFEISQQPDTKIVTPLFIDSIVKGIEIVSCKFDTIKNPDNYLIVRQKYVITSFDSALYYIPEFKFACGMDTILSNSLSLKVVSIPIDTTQQEISIADIKPIVKAPFDWVLVFKIFLIVVICLFIIALFIFIYIYFFKKEPKKEEEKAPAITKLPHEIALEKLEEIRLEKIWQHGKTKEYYTQITDVLREYIEKRFLVNTLEKTSYEIIDSLQFARKEYFEQVLNMQKILITSDLVKFAKLIPDFNSHTTVLNNAVEFVKETQLTENNE
ncbi:MAG: hypothetical protein LBT04_00280 [Prevotellaceae bacterium]|jgi:large-conductance mechanosensitive channel|nr:hypothetical protein [Prevotellaceae bacterium]